MNYKIIHEITNSNTPNLYTNLKSQILSHFQLPPLLGLCGCFLSHLSNEPAHNSTFNSCHKILKFEILKLTSLECLAELPSGRRNIVTRNGAAVACGDPEGEALSIEVRVALPVLAPIARHCLPPGLWSFDRDRMQITSTAYIGDQN